MSNIKWRPNDTKKLAVYVRKFNAAISRLEKKHPELEGSGVLPQRIDITELKSRIITRSDYNRELRKIDRLFKKGSQDIVKDSTGYYTTKWEKREQQYAQQRINQLRKRTIEKYGVRKEQVKFLGLEQVDLEKEKKRIFEKASNEETLEDAQNVMQEWYNLMYTIDRESSYEYYNTAFAKLRNAYFKAIREHLPSEEAETLIQYLLDNDIYGSDIVYAVSINDTLDFEIFYNTDDEAERARLLSERWKKMVPKIKETNGYKARNSP